MPSYRRTIQRPAEYGATGVVAQLVLCMVAAVAAGVGCIVAGILVAVFAMEHPYGGRRDPRATLAVGLLLLGCIILLCLLPRSDRFPTPGPRLAPEDHPTLFNLIRELAAATGQQMPREVYLTTGFDIVFDRPGGWLGFGKRWVMTIGLPLLEMLNPEEVRGLMARAFYHHHNGEHALASWIYRRRSREQRIRRDSREGISLPSIPDIYAKTFLSISDPFARQQEFAADALAASLVGPAPVIFALRSPDESSQLFEHYWTEEVVPVLEGGYLPPIIEGFRLFAASSRVPVLREELHQAALDRARLVQEYSELPTTDERAKALSEEWAFESVERERDSATGLLGDLTQAERELAGQAQQVLASQLTPVRWADVAEKVWVERWRNRATPCASELWALRVDELPLLVKSLDDVAGRLRLREFELITPEERSKRTVELLCIGLALTLAREGWEHRWSPGEKHIFEKNGVRLDPFQTIAQCISGDLSSNRWSTICTSTGLMRERIGM